jgi:hypothetical protein
MSRLAKFGRFWWEFIVGEDWRASAQIGLAIAATAVIAASGISAWWVLPPAVILVLYASLRRAIRD